ncbi:putative protein phosphatase [Trypanosoma conorhini]|uniref:protein-serine/threonine phosphatase n=1 Tax=Trypanosoma conorhini TaxID=83891 RepID=A0A3R7LED2_9TRYP|nr:putative protein phosphatase [Trypanosoma conorhini]RNF26756.1 putative protein phosphatase [Trypanosoma conorhini]
MSLRKQGRIPQLQMQRPEQAQEEGEGKPAWLQRGLLRLDRRVSLPDVLFTPLSSPRQSVPREYAASRLKRVGASNSSFDEDLLSYTTPLSPQPPQLAFDVLTSSHTHGTNTSPCTRRSSEAFSVSFQRSLDNGVKAGCGTDKEPATEDTVLRRPLESSCVRSRVPLPSAGVTPRVFVDTPSYCQTSISGSLGESGIQPPFLLATSTPNCTPLAASVAAAAGGPSPLNVLRTARCPQRVVVDVAHTTLNGHRNSQEDAVCIHERVAFPSDCVAREGLHASCSSTYSLYGVFDGHNGGRLSNVASLYYLEHVDEALRRAPPSLTACEVTATTTRVRPVPAGGGVDAHANASAPRSATPPQRFLSNALVQSLVHLDRTLYETTPPGRRDRSGTTAGIAALYHGAPTSPDGHVPCYLSLANLGDSRAVLARLSDGRVLVSTCDHRVSSYPSEKVRVERCGGCIEWDRVDGALEVTRSLGDFAYKLPPEKWLAQPGVCATAVAQQDSKTPLLDATAPPAQGNTAACRRNNNTRNRSMRCVPGEVPPFSFDSFDGSLRASPLPLNDDSAAQDLVEAVPCLVDNVVSNVADVYEAELTADNFLVLASDGLWDRMGTEGVVEFVRTRLLQSGLFSGGNVPQPQPPLSASGRSSARSSPSSLVSELPRTVAHTPPPTCFGGSQSAEPKSPLLSAQLFSDAGVRSEHDDDPPSSYSTPPPQCAISRWEQKESFVGSPCSCGAPRRVLQAVANSLADHVLHHLHSADNVTLLLMLFHHGE